MKKFFSLVLALVMALSLTTVAWATDVTVGTGGTHATMEDAVAAAGAGDTIVLKSDVNGNGVKIDKNLTIDLGGFTYTIDGYTVGSKHTETLGIQIADGITVTIKNGTIVGSDLADKPGCPDGASCTNPTAAGHDVNPKVDYGVKMVIQNYANLTLDGVTVTGNSKAGYVVSNNSGNVVLEDTTITAAAGNVAFDTCKYGSYTAPTVTVKGTSVINGTVEAAGGKLEVQSGTVNGDISVVTGGQTSDVVVKGGTFTDDVIPYLASGSVYKDGVVTAQGTVPSTGTTSTGSVTSGTVTPSKPTLYKLAAVGGSMMKDDENITEIKLTTVSGKIDSNVPKYVPNIYKVDGIYYIEVAKSAADYALYNNGAWIYLFRTPYGSDADVITAYATSVVMDKLVVPTDDEIDCGDCLKNGALASYYVSGDSVYYAGGYTWAYFNGEFVKYDKDTKVAFQGHTWDATSIKVRATDVKGTKVPVTIECSECEKTFTVVGAAKFDNTWVKEVDYTTFGAVTAYGQYYIVLDNATSAPVVTPSTDKTVTSADTFDAGIAMYVGMSVLAAAGSAVVIGKKRED